MARRPTVTLSGNVSLQDLGPVYGGGIMQIGGTFGGGTLTMFISLDGGTTKNALKDNSGAAYSTTGPDTFSYDLPERDNQFVGTNFYVTLAGSTSPSITLVNVDKA